MSAAVVVAVSLLYFALLFAVAYYADKRREAGQSIVSNAHAYSLSLAVYFTAWSFYGNVGRAATVGLDFLPPDLSPTLLAFTWWFLLRKMVRISREEKITSIADFISSRYGKSEALGAIITLFTVVGIMPYIALQLKAVAHTFDLLTHSGEALRGTAGEISAGRPETDYAFLVALVLAAFGVLFGARRLAASERHEGLVAAIVLESVVKLVAILSAGLFVTYGLFDGFTDIFARFAAEFSERQDLLLLGTDKIPYSSWFTLNLLTMLAFMLLPRQFHIMVIENSDEKHIRSAMWRYPAYAFLFNLFVVPIALGGLLLAGGDTANADFYLLDLPLQAGRPWLATFIFLGGFSASAGMVMASSVAIATMILNHLVMPLVLRLKTGAADLSGWLINIKRGGIVAVILLGYLYYRLFGESYALVNIGLVSFVAAAQFAPSFFVGLYWKRANRRGAIVGLLLGFIVWFYTLLIPSFVQSGWLPADILEHGPFGLQVLRPLELFGLSGLDRWSHALFWTLFCNAGAFVFLSLFTAQSAAEREQAVKFVDVFSPPGDAPRRQRLSRAPSVLEFVELMGKFIGEKQAQAAIGEYLGDAEIDERGSLPEARVPELKRFTEKTLAASVGAAPARIIVDNYLAARGSEMEDVFDIFGSVSIARKTSREQLGVLYETARLVASGDELQTILDNILEFYRRQFKFDLCVIRILDEERSVLRVVSQRGMSSEHLGKSERDLSIDTYVGEAFLNNSLRVVNDTDFLDKPVAARILRGEGIKAFAHAPITVEGEPVGVLSTFSRSAKGIFSDEFLELYKSLAGQIGVAWRNARQTESLIEAKKHERELQIARSIQLGLLPDRTPDIPGIALAGVCVPAREVGGDYYDYFSRDSDKLELVIADVSGHNVGAALIMTAARSFMRTLLKLGSPYMLRPREVLSALNESLYEDLTHAELFITMFYLSYQTGNRQLTYVSAGHNPPLLWRAQSRSFESLDADGLILGVLEDVSFEERRAVLQPGDLLLLYTDGIIEAENAQGVFFGEERLCTLLRESLDRAPQQIIDLLLEELRLFTGSQSFHDDVSLVAMRVESYREHAVNGT